jgi:predicted cupin superfamily sugar epimerase
VHVEAARLIRDLGLRPHPEGGYFAEAYRSGARVVQGDRDRHAITSIYYLLSGGDFSAFHRLTSDELWHHYEGGDIAIECIDPAGGRRRIVLSRGGMRQAAIAPGVWFAAHLTDVAGYALVGCDVAPGFEYEDSEIASRDALVASFPQHAPLIERLTRVD